MKVIGGDEKKFVGLTVGWSGVNSRWTPLRVIINVNQLVIPK